LAFIIIEHKMLSSEYNFLNKLLADFDTPCGKFALNAGTNTGALAKEHCAQYQQIVDR
jgi:hypothetical protein